MSTFSSGNPMAFNNEIQEMPAAPAPFATIFTFFIDFFTISRAFKIPATVMIAVPCWSSWNTGIFNLFFNSCSIIKQSGDAISSKLIPPKLFPIFAIQLIISSAFCESTSMSIESMSANLLNKTAFPSITGFEAREPKFPSPKIADPLEITATVFPLLV